jgi:hypothetical protein
MLDPSGLRSGDNDHIGNHNAHDSESFGGGSSGGGGYSNGGGNYNCSKCAHKAIGALIDGQRAFFDNTSAELVADLSDEGAFNQHWSDVAKPIAEAFRAYQRELAQLQALNSQTAYTGAAPDFPTALFSPRRPLNQAELQAFQRMLAAFASTLNVSQGDLVVVPGLNSLELRTYNPDFWTKEGLAAYQSIQNLEIFSDDWETAQIIDTTRLVELHLVTGPIRASGTSTFISAQTTQSNFRWSGFTMGMHPFAKEVRNARVGELHRNDPTRLY